MSLFRNEYRKEPDLELIEGAALAYQQAPPERNTRSSRFARNLGRSKLEPKRQPEPS